MHAMKAYFENEDTEAVLLVDASNAFNSLNRKVALYIQHKTPLPGALPSLPMYTELIVDGLVIFSEEGTTHSA